MPTRDTPWPDGTPCWVDYGAPDPAAAKTFYGGLLGWTFTEEDEAFGNYVQALLGGKQAAGMGPQMNADDPVAWTTYFATGDLDAHLAKVREAGGTVVMEPMQVGPMGSMAIALDPQGSAFGLWQAGSHTGIQVYNEPGAVTWNEAAVDDPDAARAFYAAVFGYEYDEVPDAGGYTTFRAGDRGPDHPLGGLGGHQPGSPTGWQTCFAVASTDDAVSYVESHGGKTITAPQDTPFGRFAVVEDPWGGAFSVMQQPAGS
ncbi:VOC family protein [Geodermatophilus sp. YIM 151500]|uniref:VOC family protein n=1 Tax=Geodermatophilus sp. YIM 151500 TaxID=2984531 RepID=UPI0021E36C3A|nr:VOC family protein [Geodermatophilus sp. YIM 151500]MCV2491072.1 VOC family protein [Geodermatophilus sp. YIM 151500]